MLVERKLNIAMIVAFLLMIGLPLIMFNRTETFSVIENKTLAQKPELYSADGRFNDNFRSEYENYFNDNVGFRQDIVLTNLLLKKVLFNESAVPNFFFGENGEAYYSGARTESDTYAGRNMYSDYVIWEMTNNFSAMNEYFQQQGCAVYSLFIPNKEAIYYENYNPYVYRAEKSKQDVLCEYILENTEYNIINVKDALLNEKDKELLYYKTYDPSHWNMNGAFVGYTELMKQIKRDMPETKILTKEDFIIEEKEFVGYLKWHESFVSIKKIFNCKETLYNYKLKDGDYNSVLDTTLPEGLELDPNLWYEHYHNDKTDNEKKVLIFGDSYTFEFMLPILAESFKDLYFVHRCSPDVTAEVVEALEPEIVIWETVERGMWIDELLYDAVKYKEFILEKGNESN